CQQGNGIPLTF
nr:immunoglobulin light chain junction region [Macaca mulatta]MOX24574.1 immunoglobulin light chain junction region [Macaca mulatta]MOX24600.1 immunoglobulin light chain junction region [Macaca mulatta]MOX24892.1 immunoglobulin light chain junction region [Macaca mulatta]MOX24900.1 immunoglobulin light chain junction region [Macaca mulatta]